MLNCILSSTFFNPGNNPEKSLNASAMAKRPKVSIILRTYNRAHLLPKAIDSVLSQTFGDFEVLIIDDGSTDTTRNATSSFRDERLRYYKKRHEGPSASYNFGLKHARGNYIGYLDDDDILYPNHLKTLSAFLDTHSSIGLVYADIDIKSRHRLRSLYPWDFSKKLLEVDNVIPGNCSLLHRKACIAKTGLYKEALHFAEDWDFWLRLSDSYKIAHIKETVAQVRPQKTSITYNKQRHIPAYTSIILRRLRSQKAILPFPGYYLHVAFRLIYKFRSPKESCISFIKKLILMNNTHPEARISLCLCYLAYHERRMARQTATQAVRLLQNRKDNQLSCLYHALIQSILSEQRAATEASRHTKQPLTKEPSLRSAEREITDIFSLWQNRLRVGRAR